MKFLITPFLTEHLRWMFLKVFRNMCTNADLKIFLHVCVLMKTILWKFRILSPKNSRVICPVKCVNFLKSRLIFNIFYCFWMYINKLFTYLTCACLQKWRCFNVKSSIFYFHMKTKISADFQIFISVPLIPEPYS